VGVRVATDHGLTPRNMVAVNPASNDAQGPMRIAAVAREVDASSAVLVFAHLAVPDLVRLGSYIDSPFVPRR